MIAKLTGRVDSLGEDWAVIDVGGVGYLAYCPARTLSRLAVGESTSLVIETHVRENAILLFGFLGADERSWFRLLTSVQGVGPRLALAILSVHDPDGLAMAIAAGDKAALTRCAGVGSKLAARIVSELKEKVAAMAFAPMPSAADGVTAPAVTTGPAQDAVSGLINLGYSASEAFRAVSQAAVLLGEAATVEALIRAGLAEMSPREMRH